MGFITRKGVKSFRVKGKLKGVKNLYIASQWIMAPGGLPVAVKAGKFAGGGIGREEKHILPSFPNFVNIFCKKFPAKFSIIFSVKLKKIVDKLVYFYFAC